VWHHSRAHRFFAAARWSADEVGLVVLRLVTGWLVPAGAPVVIAVDDTMFRRSGRKVHAACWAYDGSRRVAPGSSPLSRGNTFVVAAVVVQLPFLDRPVALPVAARLWRKGGPPRTRLAAGLIRLIAAAPACRGRRGRPRTRGERIGTWAQLRAAVPGHDVTLTRYGKKARVTVSEHRCLRPGVYRSVPVRVIIVTEPRKPGLALVTTGAGTPAVQLITRYASRRAIEVAFSDAKNTTGAGEARDIRVAWAQAAA
jgi:DDE superfamily endonuclease